MDRNRTLVRLHMSRTTSHPTQHLTRSALLAKVAVSSDLAAGLASWYQVAMPILSCRCQLGVEITEGCPLGSAPTPRSTRAAIFRLPRDEK